MPRYVDLFTVMRGPTRLPFQGRESRDSEKVEARRRQRHERDRGTGAAWAKRGYGCRVFRCWLERTDKFSPR